MRMHKLVMVVAAHVGALNLIYLVFATLRTKDSLLDDQNSEKIGYRGSKPTLNEPPVTFLGYQTTFLGYQTSYTSDLGFEAWIAQQKNRSFHLMLENIASCLSNLPPQEVLHGIVIASPLRNNPNYFFNWIRDSALTIRSLIHHMSDNPDLPSSAFRSIIELYIELNIRLQRLPNRSGIFNDEKRSGLGEPKFLPNGCSFEEPWGRPQSDGPALRILTVSSYLNYLKSLKESNDNTDSRDASSIYRRLIKPDLEYVMKNWRTELFDLWEEIRSFHFFNALVQLRSIKDGLALAMEFEDSQEFLKTLRTNFKELKEFILDPSTGFYSRRVAHIIETPSLALRQERSGLDAAVLLASLHAHDTEAGVDDCIPFDIDESHILNTITAMVADMKNRYPINKKASERKQHLGAALGRYPEDVYDGYASSEGNPWFICTVSASEVLYKLVFKKLHAKSDIVITKDTREFYSSVTKIPHRVNSNREIMKLKYGSKQYNSALYNILEYSDSFMKCLKNHVGNGGHMLEQFNRNTGYMQGANDLTWSYSSFVSGARWRTKAYEMVRAIQKKN